MAKNILLKDQEPAAKGKTTKGKRKKAAPKAETSSAFSFALLGQMKDTWADERTRSVSGLVALGLALIFTLSVFSSLFTGALDIRILQNAGSTDELEAYHNILGSLGAHVGYFLARQGLGIGALALPFLLGLLGLRWLTDRAFLPLAKTFRISAFLAMFLPWALAFLTHTTVDPTLPATSALNDHITGAAGLWLLGQSLQLLGATGSGLTLMIVVSVMLAYNTPALWKRLGQRAGAWFKSSEEAMMEEDAMDEAAMQQAAANTATTGTATASAAEAKAASTEENIKNVLLASEQEQASDEVPFDVTPTAPAPETATPAQNVSATPATETPAEEPAGPSAETPAAASTTQELDATPPPAEPVPPVEDMPLEVTKPEEAPEATKEEDNVEFEVKEVQEEETLSEEQLKDLAEEFGEEYDPTLDLGRFQLPNLDKLVDHGDGKNRVTDEELQQNKENILRTLANFKIEVSKITAEVGPTVTLYEIVPAPGIRISKIKNLEDDIALSLAALGIRIIAPIPGKGTIGIEVPNSNPDVVSMRTLIASDKFQNSDAALPIALGKTISNETYVFDMAKMPHLLMAGATGQGKSVGLNAMLVSMLYRRHPSQLKFVLVDPKKVELTLYNKIVRHYLAQLPDSEDAIITDTSKVVSTLNSLVRGDGPALRTAQARPVPKPQGVQRQVQQAQDHSRVGRWPPGQRQGPAPPRPPLHAVHRAGRGRICRLDHDGRQGSGNAHRPSRPTCPRHRHPPDHRHPASFGEHHHGNDQGQLPRTCGVPGHVQNRLPHHPRRRRRRPVDWTRGLVDEHRQRPHSIAVWLCGHA